MKSLIRSEAEDSRVPSPVPHHPRVTNGLRGYGKLIENQYILLSATDEVQRKFSGPQSKTIGVILRGQCERIVIHLAQIALICDGLPFPTRFYLWANERSSVIDSWNRQGDRVDQGTLLDLVTQHEKLASLTEALREDCLTTKRSQLILSDVSRSHSCMALLLIRFFDETRLAT